MSVKKQMKLEDLLLSFPEVEREFTFSGFNILNSTSQTNSIASFVTLKPWKERTKKNQSASALVGQIAREALNKIPKAYILPFMPPPIMGLSTTGGIEGYIQSKGNGTAEELSQVTDKFIEEAKKITERTKALQLIKELCLLANIDKDLSDGELDIIIDVAEATNIEQDKVIQINRWVLNNLVLAKVGRIILEEDNA